MMKFALNHSYKFDIWWMAFLVGFCQMFAVASVEVVNLTILLVNDSIIETIMNFLAFVMISEFDDYFFDNLRDEPVKDLISDGKMSILRDDNDEDIEVTLEDLTNREVTTSEYSRFKLRGTTNQRNNLEKFVDVKGAPKYIFVDFWDNREPLN